MFLAALLQHQHRRCGVGGVINGANFLNRHLVIASQIFVPFSNLVRDLPRFGKMSSITVRVRPIIQTVFNHNPCRFIFEHVQVNPRIQLSIFITYIFICLMLNWSLCWTFPVLRQS